MERSSVAAVGTVRAAGLLRRMGRLSAARAGCSRRSHRGNPGRGGVARQRGRLGSPPAALLSRRPRVPFAFSQPLCLPAITQNVPTPLAE